MTIIESLSLIPASFYISAAFLPVMLFGYQTSSKAHKVIKIKVAKPEDQLKDKQIVLQKEINTAVFFGASIAFGIMMIMSLGTILGDYRESRNLFAPALPTKTLPPNLNIFFPPAPPPVNNPSSGPESNK